MNKAARILAVIGGFFLLTALLAFYFHDRDQKVLEETRETSPLKSSKLVPTPDRDAYLKYIEDPRTKTCFALVSVRTFSSLEVTSNIIPCHKVKNLISPLRY